MKLVEYGKINEFVVCEKYVDYMICCYFLFKCLEIGIFVFKDFFFFVVFFDGIFECKCCGKGFVEIKCLYSL